MFQSLRFRGLTHESPCRSGSSGNSFHSSSVSHPGLVCDEARHFAEKIEGCRSYANEAELPSRRRTDGNASRKDPWLV